MDRRGVLETYDGVARPSPIIKITVSSKQRLCLQLRNVQQWNIIGCRIDDGDGDSNSVPSRRAHM